MLTQFFIFWKKIDEVMGMIGFNRKKIFSIIIPVYNGKKTIERTLASFISNKNYIKQVIIIDDCSIDGTNKIIEKWKHYNFFNIVYTRNQTRVGPGASRKKGIELSTAEWITFVDADDCIASGCLRYVYDNIKYNKNVVLIHSKSIYYESGKFNVNTIDYSDTSCGGNFYKRKYLVDNNLYPHDLLMLVEDQYFNEKIMYYMEYCDDTNINQIGRFDYPVYEVYHDIDDGYSYALRNWEDYCIKYRLLYKQCLINDFIEIDSEQNDEELFISLFVDYIQNFIFCFYLAIGLQYDEDVQYDIYADKNRKLFKYALEFYQEIIGGDLNDFIDYYNNNKIIVDDIINTTYITLGFEYEINYSFIDFVDSLLQDL